ncbi:DNA-directed RNA polymerase subunit alpha C-terminal domain-containing protein [Actinoallomurus iriomotensis]|uniref:HTH cro/C1-type domain-containing protein n=1 Tax=Actinoallomurus iriomotensis TaxID=478107 RepID=A0A9W6VQ97_9ACTN|nr:DNA-directed RNA polymerase subunit alpha C-terminal domain-containing protein [Actinoallomurus iriomotensis]GLY74391.1 hypothetical protein Airi01_026580 [Actinoallomurus iriomotensis]
MTDIALQLAALRQVAALSTHELAARTGLSQPRVSRVERGMARLSNDEVRRWCQVTGADWRTTERLVALNTAERRQSAGLKAVQTVKFGPDESVTISIGRDRVHVITQDRGLIESGDQAAHILSIVLLADLADSDSAESSTERLDHSDQAHSVRLDCPIRCLGLSRRTFNALKWGGDVRPVKISDLVALTEDDLRQFRNIGSSAVAEIKTKLADAGLRLAAEH